MSDLPDPIDRAVFDQLRALQAEDELRELVNLYLDYTPQLLAAQRDALARGDAPALQRAAHTLKGSSASLGATALAALCQEIETRARADTLTGAADLLTQAEGEFARVRDALAAMG